VLLNDFHKLQSGVRQVTAFQVQTLLQKEAEILLLDHRILKGDVPGVLMLLLFLLLGVLLALQR
jgi:hypothetical protein